MSGGGGAPIVHPIASPALRASREVPTTGLSRRTLLRRALGASAALLAVEATAGTVGFLWSAVRASSPVVRIGTLSEAIALAGSLPIEAGFPLYVPEARSFVVILDPGRGGWVPGDDPTGDGALVNVRAMSQRCPHLGCRPNPCLEDGWFHCPCHQSRYDRLGTKAAGDAYGPAPRGLDRYAVRVDGAGVLFVDTSRIVLGPLPVALGQPGLIPPLVENGCV
jgi:cytochrome b6-f complex iron-sulfur subunit